MVGGRKFETAPPVPQRIVSSTCRLSEHVLGATRDTVCHSMNNSSRPVTKETHVQSVSPEPFQRDHLPASTVLVQAILAIQMVPSQRYVAVDCKLSVGLRMSSLLGPTQAGVPSARRRRTDLCQGGGWWRVKAFIGHARTRARGLTGEPSTTLHPLTASEYSPAGLRPIPQTR